MGMFDRISVFQQCPSCRKWQTFEAQTKDLDCILESYRALPADWETSDLQKPFRQGLPVARKFPFDREQTVWKNQAERIEAAAQIPDKYVGKLNFVEISVICACRATFRGKIKIVNAHLAGEIYDIVLGEKLRQERPNGE